MTIGIDLRSIQKGTFSGVENYTLSLLERMIKQDSEHAYKLFYNGLGAVQEAQELRFLNSTVVKARWPNKLLALATLLLNKPDMLSLLGDFDLLFMPNVNHVSLQKSKKMLLTVHDLSPLVMPEVYNWKRRMWHWSVNFKKVISRADHLIATSEYTKQDIVRLCNIPPERVTVIYQGVDHERYRPDIDEESLRDVRNRYKLPGQFMLYIGTLEPRKNVERLVRAWDALPSPIPLVIVGRTGWKYGQIFKAISNARHKSRIHLLGFVSEEDKPAIIKLAEVCAFPSLYEGFGLPVIEAMAVGTPVITSQITSLPEISEGAALLVNPYDLGEMTRTLKLALTDLELRKELTKRGLITASKYSWDTTAKKTLDVINSLA